VHTLYATDGREPAVGAGRLLVRLAEPQHAEVTAMHVDEYGNEIVADRFAEAALGSAIESLKSGAQGRPQEGSRQREAGYRGRAGHGRVRPRRDGDRERRMARSAHLGGVSAHRCCIIRVFRPWS
jgi:hypothetical protein